MAEHDSDREDREDREGGSGGEPEEQSVPFDEEAAWAAIVAGYGDEPTDPPGAKPYRTVKDLALPEPDAEEGGGAAPAAVAEAAPPAEADSPAGAVNDPAAGSDDGEGSGSVVEPGPVKEPVRPLGGSVSFAPGVGPRDYTPPEPSGNDVDDEGHFVPPEPPELPEADATAKFAWLGAVGGPVLLLLSILLGWEMTWWLATAGIGGFLGGFATLVVRMRPDDEDDEDPGRGAVV